MKSIPELLVPATQTTVSSQVPPSSMLTSRYLISDDGKTIALIGYRDYTTGDIFEEVANAELLARGFNFLRAGGESFLARQLEQLKADNEKARKQGLPVRVTAELEKLLAILNPTSRA